MFHTPGDAILLRLLQTLEHRGYEFVCPGNPTIRLVRNRRRIARAGELRDVLGWSLPFIPGEFDPDVEALLVEAGAVRETAEGYQASFRCSRVQGTLLLHPAYPTKEMDSVFLGPDTYRFAEFLRNELNGSAPAAAQVVDVENVLEQMAEAKGGGGNWRTSIVDLLKLLDLDSSLDARKELAEELGVNAGAHGSAEQNVALIKAVWRQLEANGGQVPASLKDYQ